MEETEEKRYRFIVEAVPLGRGDVGLTFTSLTPRGRHIFNTFGIGCEYADFAENAIEATVDTLNANYPSRREYVLAEMVERQ